MRPRYSEKTSRPYKTKSTANGLINFQPSKLEHFQTICGAEFILKSMQWQVKLHFYQFHLLAQPTAFCLQNIHAGRNLPESIIKLILDIRQSAARI